MKLHKLAIKVDPILLAGGLTALAMVKCGCTPMLLNPTAADLAEGGKFMRQMCKIYASTWKTRRRPFEQYYYRFISRFNTVLLSIGSQLSAVGPWDEEESKNMSLPELKATRPLHAPRPRMPARMP